jgi:membrane dipeptidase
VKQLNIYLDLERAGQVKVIRRRQCLEEAAQANIPGVVILMECADPIRSPDEVAWWHSQGVRVVGMAWSRGSRYAGGNSSGGPLTAQGQELVRQLDNLGVLHDASHLSDEAFEGLCAATRERIVFTHSNARALLDGNQRHATDAQFNTIAQRDGIVGLNLYAKFLATGGDATLQDALRHVEHVASIAGRHRTGLGSDFDGGFTPEQCAPGCQRPQELGALLEGLQERGWSEPERTGFANANWMRLLRSVLA